MEQSESIVEIAKAMNKLQSKSILAVTDSTNPFFKTKYANLASVWDTIREPLTSNGFAVVQTSEPCDFGVTVITTLMHTSGEWIRGKLTIRAEKPTPQGYGSAFSYGKRYALMAIVGAATVDEDDDGESAMNREKPTTPAKKKKPVPPPKKQDVPKSDTTAKTATPSKTERKMLDYTLPNEDAQAYKDLKEYKPAVVLLNKEKTHIKVGKFEVHISPDGKKIWSDMPRFNDTDFDMSASAACLVAGLLREESAAFIGGKYDIVFTSEAEKQ